MSLPRAWVNAATLARNEPASSRKPIKRASSASLIASLLRSISRFQDDKSLEPVYKSCNSPMSRLALSNPRRAAICRLSRLVASLALLAAAPVALAAESIPKLVIRAAARAIRVRCQPSEISKPRLPKKAISTNGNGITTFIGVITATAKLPASFASKKADPNKPATVITKMPNKTRAAKPTFFFKSSNAPKTKKGSGK